jgi:CheY-like chemotaxis protein
VYRTVLVEDMAELRMVIRRALERSGRFVVVGEAADGAQGVTTAMELHPDITLLDLTMPVMDGLEALPLIRAAVPDGVVVVVSGFDARSNGEPGSVGELVRQRGAAGYVAKGARPDELVQTLLDLLEPDVGERATGTEQVCTSRLDLAADEDSPRRARRFVQQTLSGWSDGLPVEDVSLMVSELVTNAVMHARSHSQLLLHLDQSVLRVEVHDWGGGVLVRRDPTPTQPGGRGLLIVQSLSQRWGTQSHEGGKVVWFEIDAMPAAGRAR